MPDHRVLLQRISLIALTNVLLSFTSILLLPILTKNLPISDYGTWAQITVTIALVPGIAMLGLPFALTRFLPSAKTHVEIQEIFNSVFFVVFCSSATVCLLMYLYSDILALYLFDNNIIIVQLVVFITFIECLNNTYIGYFRAAQQMKKYSIISIIQMILLFSFVSFFIFSGNGLLGATIGLLIKSSAVYIILTFIIFKDIKLKIPAFIYIKDILRYGIYTIPINFSRWVVESSDRYIIAFFLGTAAVGYYSPGYALGNIIHLIIAPLSFILPAALSKYYDENNITEVQNILTNSLKYFLIVGIPAVIGLSMLSKPLLTVISTSEIASNGHLVTPFIAIGALFHGIISIYNQVLLLEKKTKITGKVVSLCAALNLGLNFILIPYIGIIGAATTTLFAYIINMIFIIYFSSNFLIIHIDFKFIAKSLISSMFIILIIVYSNPIGLFEVVGIIGFSTIVYFLSMILLKVIGKNEMKILQSLLRT